MPTFRQMEVFDLVVKCGGIQSATHGGHRVGKNTISEHIATLEREINQGPLFIRSPFKLTPVGKRLYEPIKLFFGLIDGLLARSQAEPRFTLRLGAAFHVLNEYMPEVLGVIARHAGRIHYKLNPLRCDEIVARLVAGEADVAIGALQGELPDMIEHTLLASFEPVLLVPNKPEYAHIRSAEYFWRQGTVKETLHLPVPQEGATQNFKRLLKLKNVTWEPFGEIGAIALVTAQVAANGGVGLSLGLPSVVNHPGVRMIRLPGCEVVPYVVMWHKGAREYCTHIGKVAKTVAAEKFHLGPAGKFLRLKRRA